MQTLKHTIKKYIYRIVGLSSIVILVMILIALLMNEQQNAHKDANQTFLEMEKVLAENYKELVKLKQEYAQTCLHAAEAVSHFIEINPHALYSLEELNKIAEEVGMDEIHIFNKEGKIFSGTEPKYYNYTFDTGEQMAFFKPMLYDKTLKLVQDITENTAEGKPMQYSAVWSHNGEFIVQVGMSPDKVIKVTEKNELSYIFSLFRVNPNVSYYAIDETSGVIVGSNNVNTVKNNCSEIGFNFDRIKNTQKGFYSKVNGHYSFCVFKKIDTNYIGRVVSIKHLYQNVPFTMLLILLCLMAVSFVLETECVRYMDKYVVSKIQDVIYKLKLITDGNMEEQVDVHSSLEFQELSNYINQMVQNFISLNNMEQQVNETLRTALRATDPEKALNIMLECLGKSLQGKRTYIFEKNTFGGDDNTYEWVADGVVPEIKQLQNLPPEICAEWYHQFLENKCIIFNNIEDMKQSDPLQYENLKRQDIVSIITVPLHNDGAVIGFYGVDDPPVESLVHTKNMLLIMGHFIESLLRVRNLVSNLKQMSYLDQLTQFGNRHALWEHIKNLDKGISTGIIYCDITGLKRVNDNEGHEAGDRLILSACECMRKALNGFKLFRLGGDELLAIRSEIDETDMNEHVNRLKKTMAEYGVVMALGATWKHTGSDEINSMMEEAESLMYKDKSDYYKKSGIDRRR